MVYSIYYSRIIEKENIKTKNNIVETVVFCFDVKKRKTHLFNVKKKMSKLASAFGGRKAVTNQLAEEIPEDDAELT